MPVLAVMFSVDQAGWFDQDATELGEASPPRGGARQRAASAAGLRVPRQRDTMQAMWLVVRLLLGIALAWPAADAVLAAYQRVAAGTSMPWSDRLTTDTSERIRRATKNNAKLLTNVRDAAPAATLLLTELISGNPEDYEPAELMRLALQVGVIDQLRVLLFPRPVIMRRAGAIGFAEQRAKQGKPTAYLWLPGGKRPTPSADWRRLHGSKAFEVWLCQKH